MPQQAATDQTPNSDRYASQADDAEATASVPSTRSPSRSGKKSVANKNDEPLKPYSPEWWAREKEVDERLKKTMIICNGC